MTMQDAPQYLCVALSPLAPRPEAASNEQARGCDEWRWGVTPPVTPFVTARALITRGNRLPVTMGRGSGGSYTHARACVESVCVSVTLSQIEKDRVLDLAFGVTTVGQGCDGGLGGVTPGGNH